MKKIFGEFEKNISLLQNKISDSDSYKILDSIKEAFQSLREANEVLESYNQQLQLKMVERTEELQSLLDKLQEEQAFQVAYNNLVISLNSHVEKDTLFAESLRGILKISGSQVGILYLFDEEQQKLYAKEFAGVEARKLEYPLGVGFPGQVAVDKKSLLLENIPKDIPLKIDSGIISTPPKNIIYFPILHRDELLGVFELGSMYEYKKNLLKNLESAVVQISIFIHNAMIYQRSREMAMRFKAISEKLQEKNRALEMQQQLLADQKRELDFKNKELRKASEQKSNFLSTMSHELRTPLNSIIGYTDLVLKKSADKLGKDKRRLEKVLNNAQHLLSLINNILDLSKIEAGKMELFMEEFELEKVIDTCLATAQGLIEGKPIVLQKEIEGNLPPIKTDQAKLKQILINLLGNATKFTEKGSITVRASSPKEGWIRICVEDTGPGIPKDKLQNIFESFTQVDNSATRAHGGTGLGLAIVKKMSELMHGEVFVESEVGKGSRFYLDLPVDVYAHIMGGSNVMGISSGVWQRAKIEEAAQKEKEASPPPSPPSQGQVPAEEITTAPPEQESIREEDARQPLENKETQPQAQEGLDPALQQAMEQAQKSGKKLVVVVDDEEIVHLTYREILKDTPYFPLSVLDGNKAIQVIERCQPFAVILDVILKNANGWSLLQTIKSMSQLSFIPIIVSSNIDNPFLAQSLGASYFLSKPVNREELLTLFKKLDPSSSRKGEKNLQKTEEPPSTKPVVLLSTTSSPFYQAIQKASPLYKWKLLENETEALEYLSSQSPAALVLDFWQKGDRVSSLFEAILLNLPAIEPPVVCVGRSQEQSASMPELYDEKIIASSLEEAVSGVISYLRDIPASKEAFPKPPAPEELEKSASAPPFGADNHGNAATESSLPTENQKKAPPKAAADLDEKKELKRTPSSVLKSVEEDLSLLSTSAEEEKKAGKKKILIVEDVPDNMEFVCDVLGEEYELIQARDGEEGVAKATSCKPHLILMDLLLPKIDGLEATKMILANPETSDIPVIALTAHAMVGDREQALKSGCVDYLTKPIIEDVLRLRVKEILNQYYPEDD